MDGQVDGTSTHNVIRERPTVTVSVNSWDENGKRTGWGREPVPVPTLEEFTDLLRRVEALEAAHSSDEESADA